MRPRSLALRSGENNADKTKRAIRIGQLVPMSTEIVNSVLLFQANRVGTGDRSGSARGLMVTISTRKVFSNHDTLYNARKLTRESDIYLNERT